MPLFQAVTDGPRVVDGKDLNEVALPLRQMDITQPEGEVQVQIRADGSVLWVHVEGQTVLRICRISKLVIQDERTPRTPWAQLPISELRLVAEQTTCPYCEATAGQPCMNLKIKQPMVKAFHSARYKAAAEAYRAST